MSRSSSSNAHLSPLDEAMRVTEMREYYNNAAPNHHSKLSHSEQSAVDTNDVLVDSSHLLDKLQELEAHTEVECEDLAQAICYALWSVAIIGVVAREASLIWYTLLLFVLEFRAANGVTATPSYEIVVGWVLSETESRSDSDLLRRTRRIDPLDGLRKYEGWYNITNEHYWTLAIFTGISSRTYIIAALYNARYRPGGMNPPIVIGIIFVGFLLASKFSLPKRMKDMVSSNIVLTDATFGLVILLVLLAAFSMIVEEWSSIYQAERLYMMERQINKTY